MYFPYFRGRQYELLALKELAKAGLLGKSVIPVIEPVKSSSTLNGTLVEFNNAAAPLALILNPVVGDLIGNDNAILPLYSYLTNAPKSIPALIINSHTEAAIKILESHGFSKNLLLTVFDDRDSLSIYEEIFGNAMPKYTLFPEERQLRRTVKQNKVMFEDKFRKKDRNADYPSDEFFSEDHLYFTEEGYVGFGDYSIIGNEYVESGFAPYAVAIHIVYFDSDNNLRVRHFVSDSNEDISDVAGKFYEAVSKLAEWYKNGQERQLTTGLQILLNHYENRTYPGLGTLKKLSVMHHLELMGKFLDSLNGGSL